MTDNKASFQRKLNEARDAWAEGHISGPEFESRTDAALREFIKAEAEARNERERRRLMHITADANASVMAWLKLREATDVESRAT